MKRLQLSYSVPTILSFPLKKESWKEPKQRLKFKSLDTTGF